MKIRYTTEAVVKGGRRGHGRTSDGRLEVDLSVPQAMDGDDGPGTNPEQLFALGYGACFQSAMLGVARRAGAAGAVTGPGARLAAAAGAALGRGGAADLPAPDPGRTEAGSLM